MNTTSGTCRPVKALAATLLSALMIVSTAASATDPFTRGSVRGSLILGSGQSFGEDYVILGVGAGYYVANGLEIGINWQSWLGGDPTINQITPEVTYVFRNSSNIDPYIGALYRKTFISDGFDDLNAWGARGGVNIITGPRSYLGLGAVYLKYTGCSETVYTDCSDWYPEILFSVTF